MPVILHMICLLHHASCHENAQRTSARNSIFFASLDFCRGSSNACYCSLKSFFLGFNESTIILLVVVNQSSPHQLLRIPIGKGNLDAPTASIGYLTSADACRKLELCDCIMFLLYFKLLQVRFSMGWFLGRWQVHHAIHKGSWGDASVTSVSWYIMIPVTGGSMID